MEPDAWQVLGACAQQMPLLRVQWALFLFGAAAAVLAACAAILLVAQQTLARRGRGLPVGSDDLVASTILACRLALLAVGGGLTVGAWWAWQTSGGLAGSDPRQGWMAAALLLTAASLLGWRLEKHAVQWVAVLAVLAGAAALFGLLAAPGLQRLLSA
jgi:hypothetical protein